MPQRHLSPVTSLLLEALIIFKFALFIPHSVSTPKPDKFCGNTGRIFPYSKREPHFPCPENNWDAMAGYHWSPKQSSDYPATDLLYRQNKLQNCSLASSPFLPVFGRERSWADGQARREKEMALPLPPLTGGWLRDGISKPLEASGVTDVFHDQGSTKYLSNSKGLILNLQDCSYLGKCERKE